jgi:hypothetical protein
MRACHARPYYALRTGHARIGLTAVFFPLRYPTPYGPGTCSGLVSATKLNSFVGNRQFCSECRPVREGVSKGEEDGRRMPALQGVEGSGVAGPGETLGSLWIALPVLRYGPLRMYH